MRGVSNPTEFLRELKRSFELRMKPPYSYEDESILKGVKGAVIAAIENNDIDTAGVGLAFLEAVGVMEEAFFVEVGSKLDTDGFDKQGLNQRLGMTRQTQERYDFKNVHRIKN